MSQYINIPITTDSYKLYHHKVYKKLGIKHIFSYLEARKGAIFDTTTFFGLQPILKKLQDNPITMKMIEDAEAFTNAHIGPGVFNRAGWEHIIEKHNGRLPIIIKAIPEGTEVPKDNVLLTIESTDPECAFVTNHVETLITHAYYPSTVATLSKTVRTLLKKSLEETSDNPCLLDYMFHDFGQRGVSSMESAGMGGMAHLSVGNKGTDTTEGLIYAREYYNEPMAGVSVRATEHSLMTSMGPEGEYTVINEIIDDEPNGIISLVLDSYDIYSAVNYLTTELLDKIKGRDGKVVIRPDSGDPIIVLSKILEILETNLKSDITTNTKGYKVLPPYIGIIWGDGLDLNKISEILEFLKESLWSTENVFYGMGGGLLQKVNRDTQAFAFKCSANMKSDGVWKDVWKDPIDSSSGKKSKRGRLKLIKQDGCFKTVRIDDPDYFDYENELKVVFENGFITKEFTFDEVRENANK